MFMIDKQLCRQQVIANGSPPASNVRKLKRQTCSRQAAVSTEPRLLALREPRFD